LSSKKRKRKLAGIVSQSSEQAVIEAAARLNPHLLGQSWLAVGNHFLEQTASKVDGQMGGADHDQSRTLAHDSIRAAQLAEFIAASVILHCADGWSYLGRAMAAQLRGDTGAATHLAYYAELRAAMSLLASQGIGVFNSNHAIVKHNGDVDVFPQAGTHQFTWDVLEEWSRSSRSTAVVTTMVRPAGASLEEWYEAFTAGAQAKDKGDRFLLRWGLDIKRFATDKDARAGVSYGMRTVDGCSPPSSERAAEFGASLWRALEPDGREPFGNIDRHLLRRTLESAFRERTGKKAANAPKLFGEYVKQATGSLQLSLPAETLEAFLARTIDPADLALLGAAEDMAEIDHPENHLHMLARATLLLRLSTGCAKELLGQAAIDYADFQWWCEQLAGARALIVPGELPDPPAELWADIEGALRDIDAEIAAGVADYATLHLRCPRELGVLGGCERIALLGLAA
jgi:hypothetical protein